MSTAACILGCAGPVVGPDEVAFFRQADPWGFILFGRNVETPDQVKRLTTELRNAVGWEAPVLVDQEGGRVQRLTPPHWTQWLSPLEETQAAGPDEMLRVMYLRYRLIASELREVGIDVNCAPMADIALEDTHPFLQNRCYGSDVSTVSSAARAVAQGHLDGGVLPVLKHIPGHGRSTLDSHKELPRVSAGADTLFETDFQAFRDLADLPMAMTAHIVYEAFDEHTPATQSSTMIALIREKIGFDGLLMSDDLSMEALSGGPAERAAATLSAGCDLALHCNGKMDEMGAVVDAAGEMTPRALERGDTALRARHAPDDADLAAMREEFSQLTGGAA